MKIFLLDLWNDLRAKRLWPVALVLLAGVIATPVVLWKKADTPEASPPQAAAKPEAAEPDGPAELAQVKLAELADGTGSSLSSFDDPGNPFAPPKKVLDEAADNDDPNAPAGATPGEGFSTGGGAPSGTSDGGDVNFNFGDGGTGGGTTGGGDTGDTGGDTGGNGGGTQTTSYTYVIDATFTANGRRRKIKAMEKLDILPNASLPLLIFLGVTQDAGNAVFLVDSTLDAAGEGACKPSGADCAFLYLGPGSEHEFTNDDGDSYTLRVDEIRRVKLGAKASASKKAKNAKNKTASAAVGKPAPARRFALPFLADLVSVSSGEGDHSNSDRARR